MAIFLNTTGVSHYLEQLINRANEKLILISPFLKINEKIKQSLEDKDRFKIDIRVVYGKNQLRSDENKWLKSMTSIRSSFCKDLHAKCYLNEKEAIITSMNLYEFSQINNNEMGIYVDKNEDYLLYNDIFKEVQRLIRISDESVLTFKEEKTSAQIWEKRRFDKPQENTNRQIPQMGFCIRTGIRIPFNLEKPLCYEAFKEWNEYQNINYPEKFCHFSGELSHGETSVAHPVMTKNWRKVIK